MSVASVLKLKGEDVVTGTPEESLGRIITRLSEKGIGAVVVCDQDRRVEGILSERDIVRALARRGAAALDAPVADHMTRGVTTCQRHDTIERCMELMTEGRFRHLPVVEAGRLAGIVSIGDVVKARLAAAEEEAAAMRSYIAAS